MSDSGIEKGPRMFGITRTLKDILCVLEEILEKLMTAADDVNTKLDAGIAKSDEVIAELTEIANLIVTLRNQGNGASSEEVALMGQKADALLAKLGVADTAADEILAPSTPAPTV